MKTSVLRAAVACAVALGCATSSAPAGAQGTTFGLAGPLTRGQICQAVYSVPLGNPNGARGMGLYFDEVFFKSWAPPPGPGAELGPYDATTKSLGAHTARLTGTGSTGSGTQTSTVNFTIVADATAPPAPSQITASYSASTSKTTVSWQPVSDTPLSNGNACTGLASYQYRYRQGSASFSAWTSTTATSVAIASSSAAEPLLVEVRALDRAGNASSSAVYKNDTVKPHTELDGALWEARAITLWPATYDLVIDSMDEPAGTGFGVASVVINIDGAQRFTALPDPGCVNVACDVDSDTFELDATGMSGVHRVDVISTDFGGNVDTTTWSVTFGTGLAITGSDGGPNSPDDGDSGAAGSAFRPVCTRQALALAGSRDLYKSTRKVLGQWRSAGGRPAPETTQFWDDGSYRVTRCGGDGSLVVSETMQPTVTPDGIELLPSMLARPISGGRVNTAIFDYRAAEEPALKAIWPKARASLDDDILRPTAGIPVPTISIP